MPRYFLHIVNDVSTTIDRQGRDLPDRHAAHILARETIAEIMAEELRNGSDAIRITIMIDDAEKVRIANIRAVTNLISSKSPFAE